MILIADLGATNARFCVTNDCLSFSNEATYKIKDFDSLANLCSAYITDQSLKKIDKAVIGVAAPILGDKVCFVNANLEFSINELQKGLFHGGLIVVNDLELQAYALINLSQKDISYIGKQKISDGPKVLVAPGTGLGLAGIVDETIVSTEAGHINIPTSVLRPDLKQIVKQFVRENSREPTYEDFLSGKGILYFYKILSGEIDTNLSSEDILARREDNHCLQSINILNYLLSSFLKYITLVWGAKGGVFISGSIVNSLIKEEDYKEFRKNFDDSETMKEFMHATPLAIVNIEDIGFMGGLELSKRLK